MLKKILGLDKLESKVRSMYYGIPVEAKIFIEAAGRMTEYEAKVMAPVDTGKLQQSIFYEPTKGGFGFLVSANMPYASFVEHGTSKQRAQPFLVPAFRIHTANLPENFLKHLKIKHGTP